MTFRDIIHRINPWSRKPVYKCDPNPRCKSKISFRGDNGMYERTTFHCDLKDTEMHGIYHVAHGIIGDETSSKAYIIKWRDV